MIDIKRLIFILKFCFWIWMKIDFPLFVRIILVSCNVVNRCHPHAQCIYEPSINDYICRCAPGYEGDGDECIKTGIKIAKLKFQRKNKRDNLDNILWNMKIFVLCCIFLIGSFCSNFVPQKFPVWTQKFATPMQIVRRLMAPTNAFAIPVSMEMAALASSLVLLSFTKKNS